MYIYEKTELNEYPKLASVIQLCELGGLKWRDLYMDKSNELAITFYGILTKNQIKTVIMHFKDLIDGDTNVDEISVEEFSDFMYMNRHHSGKEREFTQIYIYT